MENIKSLLARAKPKKKNDNINISISKSAMKLSKNMNISISMVSGDKKERRSNSSLGNQSSSVICIDSSESDSEQRVEHSSRERTGRDGGGREKKVERERTRPDCGRESREEGEIVRDRVYPTSVKERIKDRKRSEVVNTRDRIRHSGVTARGHHEEHSESDGDEAPAVPGRERNRFEWDRGRAGGERNVHREFERRDWSHVKERDKKRLEDGHGKKRSPERESSFSPNKHMKILEKYSPPKQDKLYRQSRSSSRESHSSRHASHSRSFKKKKKKRHRQRQSSSSSSSSSSSTSTSSNSSCSDADSSVVITKKRKKFHSRHDKRSRESTSEMAVKRLKRSSEQSRETTSEKYIKQLKSSNLLKLTPKPEKSRIKPQEYTKKSTSELFLENMQKVVSSRTPSPPSARRSSTSDDEHSESRSVTSDQLFDRLLQEPSRSRSYLSPIKMTDTGSSNASSDERLKTAVFKTVKVKEGVDAFLKSCQRILPPDEFNPVFKKVSKYMSNLSPMYLNLSSLKTFLDYKWALLDRDVKNVYIHVKDVLDELKKYKSDGSGTPGANSEASDYPSTNPKKKVAPTTLTDKYESPNSPSDSPDEDVSGNELETVEKIINKSPVHLWSALESRNRDSVESKTEADDRCSTERKLCESDPVSIDEPEKVSDMESNSNVEISKSKFLKDDENSNHSTGSNNQGHALFTFLDLKPKLAEVPSTDLPEFLDLKPKSADNPSTDLPAFLDLRPKPAQVPSTDLPKVVDSGLKQNPVKKRVMLSTISNSVAKVRDLSPVQRRKSSAEKQCFNMNLIEKDTHPVSDNDGCSDEKEDELIDPQELEDKDSKKGGKKGASEKHIRKLEKALRSCSKQIQKHDEADIDWEKDDDSNFIMAAKLKKRYMAIYNKIAEYKGLSKSLDRRQDKKFTFTESKYPAINQKIEKFVNRTKTFPDFLDIQKEVEEVNVKRQLMLTDTQVHTEAERIFVIIGKKLKRRRNDDEGLVMYSYLKPDDQGDPAVKDRELEKKLDELGKVARDKIEKVFEVFVEKQVSKGKSGEEECDDDDDDNEDDEDEEEDREEPSSQLSIQSEELSPVKQPKKTKPSLDSFKSSPYNRDPEPRESDPSDAESLGHEDSDTDEHAEHEKEMEDILNYDPNKSIGETSASQPKFPRKVSSDMSRPGSAASRQSVGSVDDLLDDSEGEG